MNPDYKLGYNRLSRQGLIDLCESYDLESNNDLKRYWVDCEIQCYNDNGLTEPERDCNGLIVPIAFEEMATVDKVMDNVSDAAHGVSKIASVIGSIAKAMA